MFFADKYIKRQKLYPDFIKERTAIDLAYIIVIPAYNEPDVISSLVSLFNCDRPEIKIEVIIVVNSSAICRSDVKEQNIKTIHKVQEWKKNHEDDNFRIYCLSVSDIPHKFAGAGMARKIGMDEAIARFNQKNNKSGVIISFDADCICDKNYLIEIDNVYKNRDKTNTCLVNFEHPLEGNEFSDEVYNGITHYELYLRYFKHSLAYTGFPFSYYTIGSCFTVKASTYIKHGGMNRNKAGEDFYFLNKIFPSGNVVELNSTRVIPSPRPSDRVVFGTGKEMEKWLESQTLNVYNFQAFLDLKLFLENIEKFINLVRDKWNFNKLLNSMPEPVKDFLIQNNFYEIMEIINSDCKKLSTFIKRFYQWFDAFRIIKFMNFAHVKYYEKVSIKKAAEEFLSYTNQPVKFNKDVRSLLEIFRTNDKILQ